MVLALILILFGFISACGRADGDALTLITPDKVIAGQAFTAVGLKSVNMTQEHQRDGWVWQGEDFHGEGRKCVAKMTQAIVSWTDLIAPEDPGVYTLTYWLILVEDGTSETLEVTKKIKVVDQDVGNSANCPTAPSVAMEYLSQSGVNPATAHWRFTMVNIAKETGDRGDLWAGNACNPNYAERVVDAIDRLMEEFLGDQ